MLVHGSLSVNVVIAEITGELETETETEQPWACFQQDEDTAPGAWPNREGFLPARIPELLVRLLIRFQYHFRNDESCEREKGI